MRITLKISKDTTQIEQMASALNLVPEDNRITIPPIFGEGAIQYFELPYSIQVHHYRYKLKQVVEISGENNSEDGLYMLNINLSNRILSKNLDGVPNAMSRFGGAGTIFYSPGIHSNGKNEIEKAYEVVFFAFPKETLQLLAASDYIQALLDKGKFCVYKELSETLAQELLNVLNREIEANTFVTRGKLLELFGKIIASFTDKAAMSNSNLKMLDIERQFKVKEILLNHIFGNPPTIEAMANEIHISASKLKTDFKVNLRKFHLQILSE